MTDTGNTDTTNPPAGATICSFCLRSSDEADKMVRGPEGAICDRCISDCAQVIDGRAPVREGGHEVAQIRLQAFAALKGWGSPGPDGVWKAWGIGELQDRAEQLAEWALARSLSEKEADPEVKRPPGLDEEYVRADERQAAEKWLCERLESWLEESPRRPAATAFTAGPLRNLARMIEALPGVAED